MAYVTQPTRPHGKGVRGLTLPRSSPLFQGPFGRIFRSLPPADFGPDDASSESALRQLGAAMGAPAEPPKDGPDAEESGIPGRVYVFRTVRRP